MTESIRSALDITNRRRKIQITYNKEHDITAKSVVKSIKEKTKKDETSLVDDITDIENIPKDELSLLIKDLEQEMKNAALKLDFEKAAKIRDKILVLEGVSK